MTNIKTNNSNYVAIQGYEPEDAMSGLYGRLFGYEVFDVNGEHVGTVDNIWMDDSGKQGFVAITTGWFFGRQCLIPADSLQVDHDMRRVTLAYSKDKVKNSPNVADDFEVTSTEAQQVREYYGYGLTNGNVDTYKTSNTNTSTVDFDVEPSGGIVNAFENTVDAASRVTDVDQTKKTGLQRDNLGDNTTEIRLAEEQVQVGKRTVESGRVRLRKVVRTEVVNQPVELRREDVIIERVDASGDGTGDAFLEDSIEIPLTREEAVVEKTTKVTGAVRARKVSDAEQQNISSTVRKEDVEVDRDVETNLDTTTTDLKSGSTKRRKN